MKKQICLNTVTIKPASLEQKIEIAADAGFDAVGLWHTDVNEYLGAKHALADLTRLLADAKLAVAETCAVFGWQYVEKAQQRMALDEARAKCELCAELQAGCVIAPASADEGDLTRAADDFVALCEAAAEFDVQVAFEFISTHRQFRHMASAWELLLRAQQENGGMVLDTHHFYLGGSELSDISGGPPEKILLVHISDAPPEPKEQLTYKDRIHVGTGVIPLGEIMTELKTMGCNCPVSLEIFNENYWKDDPKRVASEAKDRLNELLEDIGYGG